MMMKILRLKLIDIDDEASEDSDMLEDIEGE